MLLNQYYDMFRQFLLPFAVVGVTGVLTACSAMKDVGPDDYLDKAKEYVKAQQYQSAKLYIDSVKILFPKEYDKIKEGISIMREVNVEEQKRTLAFCDSMLKVRQNELPAATKDFSFQKDAQYESIGHYVPKSQLSETNFGRTYLQSKVDEKGRLIITSYYNGSRAINHTRVKISTGNGLFAESLPVPQDGALNYAFKDGGKQYEILRLNNKTENGLVDFVLLHKDMRLTVELFGKTNYSYVLSPQDKAAMKASTDLSAVLTDINRLLDEVRLAQAKLDYLYSKQLEKILEDSIR
jgi:hypothetical protein